MRNVKFTIPVEPRTKKNHQEIRMNLRTRTPYPAPSKQYRQYLGDTAMILNSVRSRNGIKKPIRRPVNVKAIYYMGKRRVVDISNLHECLHDVLVNAAILDDDSCRVIVGTDGSRVRYDKENPRTEVEIEEVTDEEELAEWKRMIPK